MTEPITVVVSIDTEEDNWVPARQSITVENIRELPRVDRLLERLGVRATYFTTYQVTQQAWSADVLRGLGATGRAEIGAHLHPWNTPPIEESIEQRNTMTVNLPRPLQVAKIRSLTEALTNIVGERPTSFRAGRWGFGASTASALLECGYHIDSSVTPFRSWWEDEGPSHVGAPVGVYRLDGFGDTRVPAADGHLIEVPLSWGYATAGLWPARVRVHEWLSSPGLRSLIRLGRFLRLFNQVVLSPEIDSVSDMLDLSRRLVAQGVRHLHVSWHSPSLRPGLSPFVRSAADLERLYASIEAYLEQLTAIAPLRFATVTEAGAALAPPLEMPPTPEPVTAAAERRLVVLSYHFPPDPSIGSLRWSGLTKYLTPLGWRSWVVTAAPPAPDGPPAGVTVESRPRRRTLNDVYRGLRRGSGGRTANRNRGAAQRDDDSIGGWFNRIRAEGGVLLAVPDEGRGWILRAARATWRLMRRLRPTVIVSSGPPHSSHLAAWLATRFSGTPWVVDMRDPWAGPITDAWRGSPFYRSRLARGLIGWLERLVLTSASVVICNTREFADVLARRYPHAHIEWVPNAVDRDLLPKVTDEPFPGLGIVHVGTIYGGRDLGPVLRALRVFLDRHTTQDARLRIAGHIEPPYADFLKRQIEAFRLESKVDLLGLIPRPDALRLVGRSRLAVVLAQGQEFQVPAKLYELVAMGVPTVVIASTDSAAHSEARRLGADAVEPGDTAGLVRVLEAAWRGEPIAAARAAPQADYRHLAPRLSRLLATAMERP